MKKHPLTPEDHVLVEAALAVAGKPVLHLRGETLAPEVSCALRLDDGKIITSTNLIAKPRNLAVCAEPFAIAEANRKPDRRIATIVTIRHEEGYEPKIVPPCGQCRENITDYAPESLVILREPGSADLFKVKASDLLPLKYADFWTQKKLI